MNYVGYEIGMKRNEKGEPLFRVWGKGTVGTVAEVKEIIKRYEKRVRKHERKVSKHEADIPLYDPRKDSSIDAAWRDLADHQPASRAFVKRAINEYDILSRRRA